MTKQVSGACLVFLALAAAASAQAPVGGEFRVNTYTTAAQYRARAAMDPSGNFVVVWTSYTQDGSENGVFGQRFNAAGVSQGAEFLVNTFTSRHQFEASVAMDGDGDFVVAWKSRYHEGSGSEGIFGQRFSAAGVPQGAEFHVNTFTTNNQHWPSVAMEPSGNFVVAWNSDYQDWPYGRGIFAQRFDAAGVPQDSEFRVNTYTTAEAAYPSVAMDQSRNFIVAWNVYARNGSGSGVFAKRFNAAGVAQADEFQVNAYTTNHQIRPSVAMHGNGNFVVAWNSFAQDGSGYGVFAQRFDGGGVPQGAELQVSTYTANQQAVPSIAASPNGSFVVAWQSYTQDGSNYGIFAQRFSASGARRGDEFRVNTYTTDDQARASVASDSVGNFVITWYSRGQDGSGDGIFAQRYGDLVFRNGFDSGGLRR